MSAFAGVPVNVILWHTGQVTLHTGTSDRHASSMLKLSLVASAITTNVTLNKRNRCRACFLRMWAITSCAQMRLGFNCSSETLIQPAIKPVP